MNRDQSLNTCFVNANDGKGSNGVLFETRSYHGKAANAASKNYACVCVL